MNAKQLYRGVVVPMITPVTEDFNIDKDAVIKIIRSFVENGIHPLLMGTTGEGQSLSLAQAVSLVKMVVAEAKGKITIYAALTGTVVTEHCKSMQLLADAGADVLVATLPSYYALTDEQMFRYYAQMADASPLPFMLYNITLTTHMSIPVDVVKRLAGHPNIVGIKDSENNEPRMREILDFAAEREDFVYFCGCAVNSALSLELGAAGIVPSGGNYIPDLYNQLYRFADAGLHDKARELQEKTNEICKVYQQGFKLGESLSALKYLLKLSQVCEDHMLPPLTSLSPENKEMIRERISQLT